MPHLIYRPPNKWGGGGRPQSFIWRLRWTKFIKWRKMPQVTWWHVLNLPKAIPKRQFWAVYWLLGHWVWQRQRLHNKTPTKKKAKARTSVVAIITKPKARTLPSVVGSLISPKARNQPSVVAILMPPKARTLPSVVVIITKPQTITLPSVVAMTTKPKAHTLPSVVAITTQPKACTLPS